MDTTSFFTQPAEEVVAEAPVSVVSAKSEDGTSDKKVLREAFKKSVTQDPKLLEVISARSNDIAVVRTMGTSKIPSFVTNKENPKTIDANGNEKHNVEPTTGICGYVMKNLGTEPIEYATMEYTKDENGIYVGTEVVKSAAPGEEFQIAKKYFFILMSKPEFSLTLENGIVAVGRGTFKATTIDEMAEKVRFQFSKDPVTGTSKSIHDDDVKIVIDADDKKSPLPEYETTFGYLFNPSKGSKRSTGTSSKVTAQQLAANYFNKLINGENPV